MRLLDMSPIDSSLDKVDGVFIDGIVPSDGCATLSSGKTNTNVPNVRLIDLGPMMIRPTSHNLWPRVHVIFVATKYAMATLAQHIVAIVLHCTDRQMGRIHAGGIVAAMKNANALAGFSAWNWTDDKFPSDAVRQIEASTNTYAPVSAADPAGDPRPASIRPRGHIDLGPKQRFTFFGDKLQISHLASLSGMVRNALRVQPLSRSEYLTTGAA